MSKESSAAAELGALPTHQLFRVLGDPTRVRLVELLAERWRACSASELAQCLDADLSVLSRHLALLRAGGVLRATKTGRTVLYEIQFEALAEVFRGIADALDRAHDEYNRAGACESTATTKEEEAL